MKVLFFVVLLRSRACTARWTLALVIAGGAAASVRAAEFTTDFAVDLTETYTDNVTASSSGGTAEWVHEVTPGVSVRGRGKHLDLALDYRLQDIRYAKGAGSDSQFHQLDATANINALTKQFNFGARVSLSQQTIDEQGTVSNTNITSTNNRTNVGTISLNPDLNLRLGDYAVLSGSVGYDRVAYQTGTNPGGANKSLSAGLSSGTRFNKIGWSLTMDASQDDASNSIQRSGQARLSYQVGAKTNVFGSFGWENNSFQSAEDPEGSIWNIGANWRAGDRTSVSASIGNRYFSRTYSANVTHSMRRSSLSLDYNQTLATTTALQLGQAVFDDTGTVLVGFGVPVEATDVFITRTLTGNYALSSRRSRLNFSFSQLGRESTVTQVDDSILTLNGSLSVTMPSSVSVSLNGIHRRSDFGLSNRQDEFFSVGVSASKRFANDVSLSTTYQRQWQSSTNSGSEFEENALTVSLGFTM